MTDVLTKGVYYFIKEGGFHENRNYEKAFSYIYNSAHWVVGYSSHLQHILQ